jgi:hemolysin activation/secretion protein
MQTLGGLYSVRGYKEAETSGDSIGVVSLEYRLHLPRLFTPNRTPYSILGVENFRVVPQHVYGQPDWDLILRPFFDVGRSWRTRATSSRINQTMIGSGIGIELVLKQNLRARFDYGWALKSTLETDSGDGRARFVVRLQY